MNEYRMSNRFFITLSFSIIFNISLMVWIEGFISRIVLLVMLLVMVYGFIEKLFLRYIITESGVSIRTMTNEKSYISWADVKRIEKVIAKKNTFRIVTGNKTFFIAPNLDKYDQLLIEVIQYCEHNENIEIEI